MQDEPYIVQPKDRVAVMLFGFYAVVKVKRVFTDTVYYNGHSVTVDVETLFETKSGMIWTTHPCGSLLSFHGRGTPLGVCATWTPALAKLTWIRRVLQLGEKREDDWALGEA
jgi:hypothetical protein